MNNSDKAIADLRAHLNNPNRDRQPSGADPRKPALHSVRKDDTTTPSKTAHPADGSDRWSVTGEAGKVEFDLLGNHLKLIDAYGDIESMGKRWVDHVHEYALLGDDDAVFAVLRDLYRTELEFAAVTR